MTTIIELDPDTVKTYLHTENELPISKVSKQVTKNTHAHTHGRNRKHNPPVINCF